MELMISSFLRKELTRIRADFKAEIFRGNITRDEVEEMLHSYCLWDNFYIDKIDRTEFMSQLD